MDSDRHIQVLREEEDTCKWGGRTDFAEHMTVVLLGKIGAAAIPTGFRRWKGQKGQELGVVRFRVSLRTLHRTLCGQHRDRLCCKFTQNSN